MTFLCPACERLAEIASARVVDGAVALRCEKCGVESSQRLEAAAGMPAPAALPGPGPVPAPAPALPAPTPEPADGGRLVFLRALDTPSPAEREDPLAVPDGFCPKCVSRKRLSGPSCASCGLVFSVFDPAEHAPPPAILDAWTTLSRAWEDDEAHDRFLQLAVAQSHLAAAGRLYRVQLAHNPDDPWAARGRDEVVRRASAAAPLVPDAGRVTRLTKRWQLWGAGVLLLFVLMVVILILRMLGVGR